MVKQYSQKHTVKLSMLFFIFIAIFVCFCGSASAAQLEVGPGQTYTTIGSAVTAAGTNDVINVHAGTYAENVVIGKSNLTLQSNSGDTVNVQTTGSSNAFQINNANYVTIKGFNIQGNDVNSGYGLYLNTASNCNLLDNSINTYLTGTSVLGSTNTISGNNYYNVLNAISLRYPAHNNVISGNTISNPIYNPNTQARTGIREDGQYFGIWTPNVGNQYLNNNINKVNEALFVQQGSNFTITGNHISIMDTSNYAWAITLSVGSTANAFLTISNNIITSDGKTNAGSRGIFLMTDPSYPANTNLQISSNSITNFTDGIIGILYAPTGSSVTNIYLNRFYNNTRNLGLDNINIYNHNAYPIQITAVNNWWSKNTGLVVSNTSTQPASCDIWYNTGSITYDPWIQLNVSALPTSVAIGGTSTVTADLTRNSNGIDTTTLYPGKYVPDGIPVTFAGDSKGSVLPTDTNILNGRAYTTFTGNAGGLSHPTATVDAVTVPTDITVQGPPTVTSWDPPTGAVNVSPNTPITVTFSENVSPGNMWIELLGNGVATPFNTNIVGNVLTIAPTSPLAEIGYKVLLHTGSFISTVGSYPLDAVSSTFKVGIPPIVTNWDPATGATLVSPNKVIKVTFNENIKAGNMWIELLGNGVATPFNTSISGKVLTITPTSPLAEIGYKLILHTGSIKDLAGTEIAATSTTFKVGVPPTVNKWDPASGATNVARNKVIKVTFSENIKAGNMWIELIRLSNNTLVAITTSISGNVLTINHAALLAANNTYKIVLHTGSVKDLAGNDLAGISNQFKTGA